MEEDQAKVEAAKAEAEQLETTFKVVKFASCLRKRVVMTMGLVGMDCQGGGILSTSREPSQGRDSGQGAQGIASCFTGTRKEVSAYVFR